MAGLNTTTGQRNINPYSRWVPTLPRTTMNRNTNSSQYSWERPKQGSYGSAMPQSASNPNRYGSTSSQASVTSGSGTRTNQTSPMSDADFQTRFNQLLASGNYNLSPQAPRQFGLSDAVMQERDDGIFYKQLAGQIADANLNRQVASSSAEASLKGNIERERLYQQNAFTGAQNDANRALERDKIFQDAVAADRANATQMNIADRNRNVDFTLQTYQTRLANEADRERNLLNLYGNLFSRGSENFNYWG